MLMGDEDDQNMLKAGQKGDDGKAPIVQGLFAYFPRALTEVAAQSKYGADKYDLKYDDLNWSRVEDGINRYNDALGRHMLDQFIDGPVDPGSGMAHRKHIAAIAWNALAVLELTLQQEEKQ
jgi:hypothetical protein